MSTTTYGVSIARDRCDCRCTFNYGSDHEVIEHFGKRFLFPTVQILIG